jgi:hypothetical protein
MPLITAKDFPQLFTQHDNSGLVQGISQAFGYMREDMLRKQAAEAAAAEQELARSGRIFAFIAGQPFDKQDFLLTKAEINARERGADPTPYEKAREILDADKRSLYLAQQAAALGEGSNKDRANYQFGGQVIFKDEVGNYFYSTNVNDPESGAISSSGMVPVQPGSNIKPKGKLERVNQIGQTRQQKIQDAATMAEEVGEVETQLKRDQLINELEIKLEKEPSIQLANRLAALRAEDIQAAATQAASLRANNPQYREMIRLVEDEGASSGQLMDLLPTFTNASTKLDNLQRRLGLNVIAGGSFGPLNESELKLALEVGKPPLDEKELVQWAKDTMAAQEKLATELENYAIHFIGGGTYEQWIENQRARAAVVETKESIPTQQPVITDEEFEEMEKRLESQGYKF